MSANPDLQQPTVVCVDGSPSGEDGLRWAARQACLTSAPLRAVIAWELPNTDGNDYGWAPSMADFNPEGDARRALTPLRSAGPGRRR